MPISAAEVGASPTLLHPDDPAAAALFRRLGPVVPIAAEETMEVASVNAAVYGWVHAMIGATAEWTQRNGLDEKTARQLAADTFQAAARMVAAHPDEPVADMLKALATPGGVTAAGLNVLAAEGFLASWQRAAEAAYDRLAANRAGATVPDGRDDAPHPGEGPGG
jgi:pyrroline-5-carboxylate reductase